MKHENVQLEKMFNATAGRIGACNTHLKSSLIQSSPDINEKLLGVLEDMFENSGTVNTKGLKNILRVDRACIKKTLMSS